jgi:hypothetical protein
MLGLWARVVIVLGGAVAAAATACGTGYPIGAENAKPLVLNDAERDLDCPVADIRVEEGFGGTWEAVGCGKKRRYNALCDGVSCEVHGEDEPFVPWHDRPSPNDPVVGR